MTTVDAIARGDDLTLTTADDSRSAAGNGLVNMQKRLEEIEGRCEWDTAPGEGTRTKLVIPVRL